MVVLAVLVAAGAFAAASASPTPAERDLVNAMTAAKAIFVNSPDSYGSTRAVLTQMEATLPGIQFTAGPVTRATPRAKPGISVKVELGYVLYMTIQGDQGHCLYGADNEEGEPPPPPGTPPPGLTYAISAPRTECAAAAIPAGLTWSTAPPLGE